MFEKIVNNVQELPDAISLLLKVKTGTENKMSVKDPIEIQLYYSTFHIKLYLQFQAFLQILLITLIKISLIKDSPNNLVAVLKCTVQNHETALLHDSIYPRILKCISHSNTI